MSDLIGYENYFHHSNPGLREMERISHEAALVRKVRKSNLDDKLAIAKELYQTLLKLYEGLDLLFSERLLFPF